MKTIGSNRVVARLAAAWIALIAASASTAQEVVIPNSFQANQPAVAAEVNENFTTLADAVNEARLEAFYGDGSEGDLDIPGLQFFVPVESKRFDNCTVQAGHTLTIFSGTVIRCRGDFVNNGTINVETYTQGGGQTTASGRFKPAHAGQGRSAAMVPGFALASGFSHGAFGGQGINTPHGAAHRLIWGPVGGGSGSGGGSTGGNGGGTLTILTGGQFINNGIIDASGEDGGVQGGGGGAGGIVFVASAVAYVNNGTIDVSGGDGGDPNLVVGQPAGPGGGGGGGLIRVVAPSTGGSGSRNTGGGVAGDISGGTAVTNPALLAYGGGGGGGCYGSGGAGGNVSGGNVSAAFDGTQGAFFATTADPIAYF